MGYDRLSQVFLKLVQDRKGLSQDGHSESSHSGVRYSDKGLVIAAVGGGGKTTALYLLASAFARDGRRVCLTTTTHIYDPRTEAEAHPFDRVLILPELAETAGAQCLSSPAPPVLGESALELSALELSALGPSALARSAQADERSAALSLSSLTAEAGSITILASQEGIRDTSVHQSVTAQGRPLSKLGGIHPAWVPPLRTLWDVVLVEADGSKHRPVKAPAEHEPVIPSGTDVVIGCIGLDCLGKPLDEHSVHRPGLFSAISGCEIGTPITVQHLINLAEHPQGLFKASPADAARVLMLNKADMLAEGAVEDLKRALYSLAPSSPFLVVLGSVRHDYVYWTKGL